MGAMKNQLIGIGEVVRTVEFIPNIDDIERLSDAEFKEWRFREYLKSGHDENYRANANGRTRTEWARDKAQDDTICRLAFEEALNEEFGLGRL